MPIIKKEKEKKNIGKMWSRDPSCKRPILRHLICPPLSRNINLLQDRKFKSANKLIFFVELRKMY